MEATFLQLRQGREENRTKSHAFKNEKTDRLDAFWASFKQICTAWNDRLHEIQTVDNEEHHGLSTEERKRQLHSKLSELADELKELKQLCLSTSSSSSVVFANSPSTEPSIPLDYSSATTATDRHNIALVLPLEEDLSTTDIRLLHRELTQCQTALDLTRHTLLPKGKFIFVRYRKAMQLKLQQEQHQQQHGHPAETLDPVGTSNVASSSRTTDNHFQQWQKARDQYTVQDLTDMSVTVLSNGIVELVPHNSCIEKDKLTSSTLQSRDTDRPILDQLILRNISNCTVILQGAYKALHMVNVVQSTILVPNAIQGAVHVTNCHTTTLTLCDGAQQLRLHTSTDLTCHCSLTAGAILEECQRISFVPTTRSTGSSGEIPLLDVKDFDWLRNDTPSPNFTIQPTARPVTEPRMSTFSSTAAPESNQPASDTIETQSRPSTGSNFAKLDENNDTDDDEL